MNRSLGIPVKLLHEAAGHIVTVELKTGELYRGSLIECEDNWNCQLENITFTSKVSQLEHVFIRGSRVRFKIIPDMLKNAPMFKRLEARIRAQLMVLDVDVLLQCVPGHKLLVVCICNIEGPIGPSRRPVCICNIDITNKIWTSFILAYIRLRSCSQQLCEPSINRAVITGVRCVTNGATRIGKSHRALTSWRVTVISPNGRWNVCVLSRDAHIPLTVWRDNRDSAGFECPMGFAYPGRPRWWHS